MNAVLGCAGLLLIALLAAAALKNAPRCSLREFWAATVMIWCVMALPIVALAYA